MIQRFKIAGLAVCAVGALAATISAAPPRDPASRNKAIVRKFYDDFFNRHRIEAAREVLVPEYRQHNPSVGDGRQAVIDAFTQIFKQFPQSRAEIKRILADGDLVAVHVLSRSHPGDRGRAVVDIFRLKNGKIVEHWDVVQPVPDKSANTNTMF